MDNFAFCMEYPAYELVDERSCKQYRNGQIRDRLKPGADAKGANANENVTTPSIFTTLCSPFCYCDDLTDLMDSFKACNGQPLLISFREAPVSSRLATVTVGVDVTPTEILTQNVALPKNEAKSYKTSSKCPLKSYSAAGSGCAIFVLAVASVSFCNLLLL